MSEYNDLQGRVVVQTRPATHKEMARYTLDDSKPLVCRLDDGSELLVDVLHEGDARPTVAEVIEVLLDAAHKIVRSGNIKHPQLLLNDLEEYK